MTPFLSYIQVIGRARSQAHHNVLSANDVRFLVSFVHGFLLSMDIGNFVLFLEIKIATHFWVA